MSFFYLFLLSFYSIPLVTSFCLLIKYKNNCFQAKTYILSEIIYLINLLYH